MRHFSLHKTISLNDKSKEFWVLSEYPENNFPIERFVSQSLAVTARDITLKALKKSMFFKDQDFFHFDENILNKLIEIFPEELI